MRIVLARLSQPLIWLAILLLALAAIFTLRYFLDRNDAMTTMAPALFGKSVVIDAGHGGWDPGVKGANGSREADVNLAIAMKLAEYCREAGATVTMTRESDVALAKTKAEDMTLRVKMAKDAGVDIFISIHCNSFPGQSGAQLFYERGNEAGQALAKAIQESIREELANTDRVALPHADAFLLHQISGATVICEAGFLSQAREEEQLIDKQYQWDMAWAIFTGIVDYLSEAAVAPNQAT
jgi:N-acetylmuramoyl-L-alanine amidase